MEKWRNCSLGAISPLFHNIFYMLSDFHVRAGTRFSLRDKRLFEISEVEITRVNCICLSFWCWELDADRDCSFIYFLYL